MTPDQLRKLEEVHAWMQERKKQQITLPLDIASQAVINSGAISFNGAGDTALTQTYSVAGGAGGSIEGPRAYTDTIVIVINGVGYEIPIVASL